MAENGRHTSEGLSAGCPSGAPSLAVKEVPSRATTAVLEPKSSGAATAGAVPAARLFKNAVRTSRSAPAVVTVAVSDVSKFITCTAGSECKS